MSALDVADARAHLGITSQAQDDDIQGFVDAAEASIAARLGPLESAAFTERLDGGGCALVLRNAPALSLTSVTPVDSSALDLADLHLDTGSGVVTYNSGASFYARYYTVVYQAGAATDDVLMAIKEWTRYLWLTQGTLNEPDGDGGAALMARRRAEELIAARQSLGFA